MSSIHDKLTAANITDKVHLGTAKILDCIRCLKGEELNCGVPPGDCGDNLPAALWEAIKKETQDPTINIKCTCAEPMIELHSEVSFKGKQRITLSIFQCDSCGDTNEVTIIREEETNGE